QAAEPSLLAGLLVDGHGARLTPSHAVKKGRRYRYYISAALISATGNDSAQNWRLAAREIEECVISILIDALTSPPRLFEGPGMSGMPGDQMRKLLGRAARLAAALRRAPERQDRPRARRAGHRRRQADCHQSAVWRAGERSGPVTRIGRARRQ